MKPQKSKSSTCAEFDDNIAPLRGSKSECTVRTKTICLETEPTHEKTTKRRLRRRPNTGACRRVRQKRPSGRIVRANRRNVNNEKTLDDVFSRLRMSANDEIIRPARQLVRNTQHIRLDIIVHQHRHRQSRRDSILAKSRFRGQLDEDKTKNESPADTIDTLTELFEKLQISDNIETPKAASSSRKRKLPLRHYTDEGPTEPKRLCDRLYLDVLVF